MNSIRSDRYDVFMFISHSNLETERKETNNLKRKTKQLSLDKHPDKTNLFYTDFHLRSTQITIKYLLPYMITKKVKIIFVGIRYMYFLVDFVLEHGLINLCYTRANEYSLKQAHVCTSR